MSVRVSHVGKLGGIFGDEIVWCSSATMDRLRQACIRHASDKFFLKKWSCWIRFGDLRLGASCVTPRRLGKVVFWPTVLAGTQGVELNMRGLGQRLTQLVGITLQSRDHRSDDGTI